MVPGRTVRKMCRLFFKNVKSKSLSTSDKNVYGAWQQLANNAINKIVRNKYKLATRKKNVYNKSYKHLYTYQQVYENVIV